jgi:hypothetical protein
VTDRSDRPRGHDAADGPDSLEDPDLLVGGRVLDAAAVEAWLRGWHHLHALVEMAGEHGVTLVIPAGAVTEAAWRSANYEDDGALDELLGMSAVVVSPLDRSLALALGHPAARVPHHDVVRSHAYALATTREWAIVTDDPEPYQLGRAGMPDPDVELIPPPLVDTDSTPRRRRRRGRHSSPDPDDRWPGIPDPANLVINDGLVVDDDVPDGVGPDGTDADGGDGDR